MTASFLSQRFQNARYVFSTLFALSLSISLFVYLSVARKELKSFTESGWPVSLHYSRARTKQDLNLNTNCSGNSDQNAFQHTDFSALFSCNMREFLIPGRHVATGHGEDREGLTRTHMHAHSVQRHTASPGAQFTTHTQTQRSVASSTVQEAITPLYLYLASSYIYSISSYI